MKRTIVCIVLFIATFSLAACSGNKTEADITEAEVPAAVKDAFTAKYPAAIEVKWEKETENAKIIYEAGFKLENKEKEACFDEAGAFIKEE